MTLYDNYIILVNHLDWGGGDNHYSMSILRPNFHTVQIMLFFSMSKIILHNFLSCNYLYTLLDFSGYRADVVLANIIGVNCLYSLHD